MLFLWTSLCGVVTVAVAVWVWYRISNRHVLRLCRAVPCALPCYPLLGNALAFSCSMEQLTQNMYQIIEESVLNGHRAVCFWIGAYPVIFVTDPDDVKKVLNNALSRGREMEESSKFYSKYGLMTSPVDHWKMTRPHLNLLFQPRTLEKQMTCFNSTSRQLVAELSAHEGCAPFNLLPLVMNAAFKSIWFLFYGPEYEKYLRNKQFEDFEDLNKHAVEIAAELCALRVIKPWLRNDFLFKLLYGKEIKRVKTSCLRSYQLANVVTAERRQADEYEDSNVDPGKLGYGIPTILDCMRVLQKRFVAISDEHVMDEMASFFATGTDTIGNTVSSCLLALARLPRVQDKVYEEICSAVPDEDDISYADLNRLTYLEQVIKETIRFFNVAPFCPRAPRKDIDLGGYTIPANKTTFLCLSATNMNPKYFPDPHDFDPDRFSTINSSSERVFMPFSRGPRNCIGKDYSMMLMKVMVARVVQMYRLTTEMDIRTLKKKYTITSTCSDGYNVSLKKRNE